MTALIGRHVRADAARSPRGELELERLPPLSLYVHLPWCVRKCPYCDFNSYESRGALPDEAYVDALLRDFDSELGLVRGRAIESVFIGGGTPSLFPGPAIGRLLEGIRARVTLAAAVEVTLEANPGAVEAGRFAQFRDAGVNRLSIGVQSFRDERLRALGRVHGGAEARRAVRLAKQAGFDSVNLDLMYGLPDDDAAGSIADLAAAVELEPEHVSWYQLTLEPNTAFERRPPALPDEDFVLDVERAGRELLTGAGFTRYEISAYARPGRECAHNSSYWRFGDYLGIGAGAHGKVTLPEQRAIERRAKTRNPRTYLVLAGTAAAVSVERIDTAAQARLEFLMNALRLVRGVSADCFEERAGQPFAALDAGVAAAVRRGWLVDEPRMLRPTALGLALLNPMLEMFCEPPSFP
ncbi:MAG TPA: radical SAM family heme chaperone HemW [Gammaproteobacteria bacterium]|nr:radical SAM family heme chaperone HemW [Gammaproteobacteria bacterium]